MPHICVSLATDQKHRRLDKARDALSTENTSNIQHTHTHLQRGQTKQSKFIATNSEANNIEKQKLTPWCTGGQEKGQKQAKYIFESKIRIANQFSEHLSEGKGKKRWATETHLLTVAVADCQTSTAF